MSFMEKMMEKLLTRYVKDETMGHVPYIHNNLPTQTTMPHEITDTENKVLHVGVALELS
jgi:hypothetical protein